MLKEVENTSHKHDHTHYFTTMKKSAAVGSKCTGSHAQLHKSTFESKPTKFCL